MNELLGRTLRSTKYETAAVAGNATACHTGYAASHPPRSDHDPVAIDGIRSHPKVTGTTAIVAGPIVGVTSSTETTTTSEIQALLPKPRVSQATTSVTLSATARKGKKRAAATMYIMCGLTPELSRAAKRHRLE